MNELNRVARFATAHYPNARNWPDGKMYSLLKWADLNGFLAVIMDYHRPVGVLFAKPVSNLLDADGDGFDFDGDTIYVRMAVAKNKEIMRMLGAAALNNWGLRQKLAYKTRGKLKVRDYKKTLTALFKHHG